MIIPGMTIAQWLEKRRGYVGGSDAAASVGLSPYTSPFKLYQDKIGVLPDTPTEAMERGRLLEPLTIRLYERAVGYKVKPGAWLVSSAHDFMASTPDGIDDEANCLIQAKTASCWGRHKWGEPNTADVPADYFCQVQHEMAVTGAKLNKLVVLFADKDTFRCLVAMVKALMDLDKICEFVEEQSSDVSSQVEFHPFPVARDEKSIKLLIEGEGKFWREHVLKRMPPDDICAPEKTSEVIEADDETRPALQAMRDAKVARDESAQAYEESKTPVEKIIGDNTGLSDPDLGKVTNKAPGPKKSVSIPGVHVDLEKMFPDDYKTAEEESRVKVDKDMVLAKMKAAHSEEYDEIVDNNTVTVRKPRVMRPFFKKPPKEKK